MITTFSIYLASMVKIGGETNWYSILSLPMSVDDHALKKRYREMLLQSHPDKNK
jgi:DnaJ-class molecular chaperone